MPETTATVEKRKKRYGMVIDLRKCAGCSACTVACSIENNVPEGHFRTWVKEMEVGLFPDVKRIKLPRLCNHCEDPPCVKVCPVQASWQNEDGVVLIDQDRCIGCKYCIAACPYEARFINPETNTADKCSFCIHRLEVGQLPACVTTCVGGARIFGDVNDPESEISKVLSQYSVNVLKPDLGTQPFVFYIDGDGSLMAGDYSGLRLDHTIRLAPGGK
ncbi:MAG: Tetrathionate reductase subunit B [Candidatus Carbobacillus altaicus]|uniref:Tetrathionate reductase subunit B n=1 Tax=Candidatus Carbonibacillus altaicus TaxID=2163959 RepID=A0A2R6XYR7_9BACL|nr:MAG: Tetrathionate reductase subunit B [Candidatus Carbobacillus altaicus]